MLKGLPTSGVGCLLLAACVALADNVVLVGDDGQSMLVAGDSAPVCLFQNRIDMPMTGGFFTRAKIWADRQNLRITSLNEQGLVFLGNQRVATLKLATAKPGDVLLRYSEQGFTLHIKALEIQAPDSVNTNRKTVVRLDVQITRP